MTEMLTPATTRPARSAQPFYVLPDTNLFLHARALQELTWDQLAPKRDIVILVPRTVQKEISKFKSDGNSRRAKRARAATTLLLQAAQAPGHAITIRDHHPRITLQLPARSRPTVAPDDLDLANPDDQIMADVISFRTANPDKDAQLLTGDTDQIVSAMHQQVPYCIIPDSWYLPPEQDERDKRITELEREVRTLKKTEPTIDITNRDEDDIAVEVITIELEQYAPLPEAVIEELINEAQQRHPPQEGLTELVGQRRPPDPFGRALLAANQFQRYEAPTAEDITNYYEHRYPGWITALRATLTGLHTRLSMPSRYTKTAILLENRGTRPADGVILTLTMHGGLQLTRKPPTLDDALPQTPPPPTGTYVTVGGGLRDRLNSLNANTGLESSFHTPSYVPSRHPNTFYREYGHEPTDEWTLNCDEFRHGDQERREIGIIIPDTWQGTNAALAITMTARNMSAPATKTIPVRIHATRRDTISAARALLDKNVKRTPRVHLWTESQ